MKALTIYQPYADMIAKLEKPSGQFVDGIEHNEQIENRTWPTAYRGSLAIHAGKSRDWLESDDERERPGMAFGAIVASSMLTGCVCVEDLPPHLRDSEHANGPWCWLLTDVRPLTTPIPWKGEQGLWAVPSDLAQQILERGGEI